MPDAAEPTPPDQPVQPTPPQPVEPASIQTIPPVEKSFLVQRRLIDSVLAAPKSSTLTRSPATTRIFDGLRSLCSSVSGDDEEASV